MSKDNGRGNGGSSPRLDFDLEEVRSALWEYRRCKELSKCATVVRAFDREIYVTGCTESKMMVAIDFARLLDKLANRLSEARQERIEEWMSGTPLVKFRRIEQVQLKEDLRRIGETAIYGGYAYMFKTYEMSAVGG